MLLTSPPLPPSVIAWLAEQGVYTVETLQQQGVVTCFLRLKAAGYRVTEHILYAMEAAARGCHWQTLTLTDKQALRATLRRHPPIRLSPPVEEMQAMMQQAILLAQQAEQHNEVPVGAVVVKEGRLIGAGFNRPIGLHDPSAHAEIQALRLAAQQLGSYRLVGCDLYVTLEPCVMCAGAILHARLDRVIFGATDPKAGAAGSVINVFGNKQFNHHTAVFGGVAAEVCQHILSAFFAKRRS